MSPLSHSLSHAPSQVAHCCPRPWDRFGTGFLAVFCVFLKPVPTVPRSRLSVPQGHAGQQDLRDMRDKRDRWDKWDRRSNTRTRARGGRHAHPSRQNIGKGETHDIHSGRIQGRIHE
jgi:hypothetical protein